MGDALDLMAKVENELGDTTGPKLLELTQAVLDRLSAGDLRRPTECEDRVPEERMRAIERHCREHLRDSMDGLMVKALFGMEVKSA